MSRAWMPLYVADYLADTGHLTTAEHGAYLLLIMHYWSAGALPVDDRKLARIARMSDKEWREARETLAEFFTDGWKHDRIERHIADANASYERRAEAGRKGGKAKPKTEHRTSNASALPKQSEPEPDSLASSSLRSEEAAAAPPPLFDREDFKRRCEEAAGFADLSGFDLIETMAKTHDIEGRILPVLREKGEALRRTAKRPHGWSYFLPAIKDPECRGAQPGAAPPPPMIWLDAGTPEFIAANKAMVAKNERPKVAISINSHPNRGAAFPAWAVEPPREAAA